MTSARAFLHLLNVTYVFGIEFYVKRVCNIKNFQEVRIVMDGYKKLIYYYNKNNSIQSNRKPRKFRDRKLLQIFSSGLLLLFISLKSHEGPSCKNLNFLR